MPTVLDATVVNQALDTSGNGGRKLVPLDNGWKVAGLKDTTNKKVILRITKDNGTNFIEISNISWTNLVDISLSPIGNTIGVLITFDTFVKFLRYDTDGNILQNITVDSGQTALGNVSLTINEAKTELHATWASKNATYPNSFNIRYAKGTINADGSVTWGAVEQRTTYNSAGTDVTNPSISLNKTGVDVILVQVKAGTTNFIISIGNGSLTSDTNIKKSYSIVYDGATYAQSSPSAIFVPQSVNGLANGRIWVAWQSVDVDGSPRNDIRVSYSDDGGVNWSTSVKVADSSTTVNYYQPSITANKNNKIFIRFDGYIPTHMDNKSILGVDHDGTWSNVFVVKENPVTTLNVHLDSPSTLYDPTFNFSEPLFIYRNSPNAKVGFYGTWTTTNISVTQGSIGQKTDKANVLTYAITTDGVMSTITEKVNGVTVGTKVTPTSGQSQIVGLTQAQWDAVRFGKYEDVVQNVTTSLVADWEQGSFTNSSGTLVTSASTTNLRTKNYVVAEANKEYKVNIVSPYQLAIFEVNDADVIQNSTAWLNDNAKFITKSGTTKFKVMLRKSDNSTITTSDLSIALPQIALEKFLSNTLTIQMGSETFTYTFDKRPATDADMISVAKAVQDSANVSTPAKKALLASAIRAKGGTISDSDALEVMASAVGGIPLGKKSASGAITAASTNGLVLNTSGANASTPYVAFNMANLPFVPSLIEFRYTVKTYSGIGGVWHKEDHYYVNSTQFGNSATYTTDFRAPYANAVVNIPVKTSGVSYEWVAYEE